jgi:uncharacterized membrane protein
VLSNLLMWITFTRALHLTPSSLYVTTINTAANITFTGIMSFILFYENLSIRWWIGAILVVIGSVLMSTDSSKDAKDAKRTKRTATRKNKINSD